MRSRRTPMQQDGHHKTTELFRNRPLVGRPVVDLSRRYTAGPSLRQIIGLLTVFVAVLPACSHAQPFRLQSEIGCWDQRTTREQVRLKLADAEFAAGPSVLVPRDAVTVLPQRRPATRRPAPVLLYGACAFRIVTRLRHFPDVRVFERRPDRCAAACVPAADAAVEPDSFGLSRMHTCKCDERQREHGAGKSSQSRSV